MAERQASDRPRHAGRRQRHDELLLLSQHYDVPINYAGHATEWDALDIEGDIRARDCVVRYRKGGTIRAVASIYRDVDSLGAEISMEHQRST